MTTVKTAIHMAAASLLYMGRDVVDEATTLIGGEVPAGQTRVQFVYGEVPSKAVSIAVGAIYVVVGIALCVPLFRRRNWWGLCLPIGSIASGIGFFVKAVLVGSEEHQNSQGLLIAENVIIVCAPAAFFAFNYIVYGRLVVESVGAQYSLIKPSLVATIFVLCDIVTFIIQAIGAAMVTNVNNFKKGKNIFVVGLVLQAASYYLFVGMFILMHFRVKKAKVSTGKEVWWKTIYVLYWSSFFIIVRTVYRIVEGESSRGSSLRTHEVYFYCLDFLPLILAIIPYIFFWPGKYFEHDSLVKPKSYEMSPTGSV